MPKGLKQPGLDLRDSSYDGREKKLGYLSDGLGRLFDGLVGRDNFLTQPNRWVGWKNSTTGNRVLVDFRFRTPRDFSAIFFHVNNKISEGAQVFKSARLWFSDNGKKFSRYPHTFYYQADTLIRKSEAHNMEYQRLKYRMKLLSNCFRIKQMGKGPCGA